MKIGSDEKNYGIIIKFSLDPLFALASLIVVKIAALAIGMKLRFV